MATKKTGEILFTTDASGQLWNVCVWDFNLGTVLQTYKGGSTAYRCLDLIAGEYLVAASNTRPLLNVWSLRRKEQMQSRIIFPQKVSALALSKDGHYCVAGIEEKLYVWQVNSGELLAIIQRHYQTVVCIKFIDNMTFVSAAEDNLVIVWSIPNVVSIWKDSYSTSEPDFVWNNHSLPITDIHVSAGGIRARVVTSSLDQTCKMWDVSTGQLLCNFVFPVSITSVVMDTGDSWLFAGGKNGHIYAVDLFEDTTNRERHVAYNTGVIKRGSGFYGHDQQITCLVISRDCERLVSGSNDCNVKIWDVSSGQCLRTLPHKGPVTNVIITGILPSMVGKNSKQSWPLGNFQLTMSSDKTENTSRSVIFNKVQNVDFPVHDLEHGTLLMVRNRSMKNKTYSQSNLNNDQSEINELELDKSEIIQKLKRELKQVKAVNEKLFAFTTLRCSEIKQT